MGKKKVASGSVENVASSRNKKVTSSRGKKKRSQSPKVAKKSDSESLIMAEESLYSTSSATLEAPPSIKTKAKRQSKKKRIKSESSQNETSIESSQSTDTRTESTESHTEQRGSSLDIETENTNIEISDWTALDNFSSNYEWSTSLDRDNEDEDDDKYSFDPALLRFLQGQDDEITGDKEESMDYGGDTIDEIMRLFKFEDEPSSEPVEYTTSKDETSSDIEGEDKEIELFNLAFESSSESFIQETPLDVTDSSSPIVGDQSSSESINKISTKLRGRMNVKARRMASLAGKRPKDAGLVLVELPNHLPDDVLSLFTRNLLDSLIHHDMRGWQVINSMSYRDNYAKIIGRLGENAAAPHPCEGLTRKIVEEYPLLGEYMGPTCETVYKRVNVDFTMTDHLPTTPTRNFSFNAQTSYGSTPTKYMYSGIIIIIIGILSFLAYRHRFILLRRLI